MAMKVIFTGVGEAFDEGLCNTSLWVQSLGEEERASVLLDCGFTVPSSYWSRAEAPETLDALWVSHFHGDHFFGIPALLLRFWEAKRTKPLSIIGQRGIEELIRRTMDLAYPNLLPKLAYPLEFIAVEPEFSLNALGLHWRFAQNGHGQPDLAVRIEDGKSSLFYSGDGRPTHETRALARGADLVVHEAFRVDQPTPGHGTVKDCIQFGLEAGAGLLALVHLQRDERRERLGEILELIRGTIDLKVILPEPGDTLEI
jgi:ribonuclease Z